MVLIDGGGAYGIGDIEAHNAWGAYLKIYRGGAYRKVSGYIIFFIGAHNAWWGEGAPITKYI